MSDIFGIKFKEDTKTYYFTFDTLNLLKTKDFVIVDGSNGPRLGKICSKRQIKETENTEEFNKIIKKATPEDIKIYEENLEKEKQAFEICKTKIKKNNLEMKLISVHYAFDRSKLLFFFSSKNRIDFRNLVKELASIFKVRIELRQIGVRDEAKTLGGLGVCGKPFCCCTFLNEFQPVSIKMAKEQDLSLSPIKISGACGRLMCCLKYEQDAYSEILNLMPKIGSHVETPEGTGIIVDQNILKSNVLVKMDRSPESLPLKFHLTDIKYDLNFNK